MKLSPTQAYWMGWVILGSVFLVAWYFVTRQAVIDGGTELLKRMK